MFSIKDIKNEEQLILLIKPIGEFVLIMELLKRWGIKREIAKDNLRWAWDEFGQGKLFYNILKKRPELIILSSIYPAFFKSGFNNEEAFNLIKHLLKLKGCHGYDLPMWRRLDLELTKVNLGLRSFDKKVLSQTYFGNFPEPWLISNNFAYAITHEVFYITDFGTEKNNLPKEFQDYLKLWIPSWIEIFIEDQNWDITAELIMIGFCIGIKDDLDKYIYKLASQQQPDGIIPSPKGGGEFLMEKRDSNRRKRFLKNYHTSLVSLMIFGAFLKKSH